MALYTAQELPRLLSQLKAYQNGDLEGALQEAFMTFDASLKQKAVIEKLKRLAGIEECEEREGMHVLQYVDFSMVSQSHVMATDFTRDENLIEQKVTYSLTSLIWPCRDQGSSG